MTADHNERNKEPTASSECAPKDLKRLLTKIESGDPAGVEELYRIMNKGARFLIARAVGADEVQDRLDGAFAIVLREVQSGRLRDPDRLLGRIRSAVRNLIGAQELRMRRKRAHRSDPAQAPEPRTVHHTPEEESAAREREEIMQGILPSLTPSEREALTCYYCYGEPAEGVMLEMGLTAIQFQRLRDRVRNKYTDAETRYIERTTGPAATVPA